MVKVTVVQDDKKVFEREGKFFTGTTIIDSDKDIVDAYVVAFGEANARDVTIALAELAVDAVRVASPSRMECIINLAALKGILHSHIAEELAGLPQGLAEKMQKIMED